jgi:hypothetical protein
MTYIKNYRIQIIFMWELVLSLCLDCENESVSWSNAGKVPVRKAVERIIHVEFLIV